MHQESNNQQFAASDLRTLLEQKIAKNGGYVNAHTHLDRAFTITPETLKLADAPLQEKWDLVDDIKRRSTVDQIYDRMAYAAEKMLMQGVTVLMSFIDVDEIIGDKAMKAAQRLRQTYGEQLILKFANQTLKGVLDPEANKWFLEGAAFTDIIGGLPHRDNGRESEHLDVLLTTGKRLGKMVHVHVDQFNDAGEKETELLAHKTIEHGMQGQVVAIHSVSLAAHPLSYREEVYGLMQQAKLMVITCPTAWIDSRRSEILAPTHNSIVPVEELIAHGIPVAIGSDNIADIYKPFTDGSLWMEMRFLLESCHFYDLEALTNIATKYGRRVMGLE